MARVELDGVTKEFADGTVAVDRVSLDVSDQEFLVLVGPSGCGKTTLLRMISGLETCTSGEIRIGGRCVNGVKPRNRDVAMVFQGCTLFPHMSVFKNLAFGLKLRCGAGSPRSLFRRFLKPQPVEDERVSDVGKLSVGERRRKITQRVSRVAELLGVSDLLNRKPFQLSGGERQRVALGCAIVREPAAFLFDEPLTNLDASLRRELRLEIVRLQQRLQATMLFVTHDHIEAMTMGTRLVVMDRGRVRQLGTPQEVYQRPSDTFVANFVGELPMNLFSGELRSSGGKVGFASQGGFASQVGKQGSGMQLSWESSRFQPRGWREAGSPAFVSWFDRPVLLGIRPEDVTLVDVRELGESVGGESVGGEPVNGDVSTLEAIVDSFESVGDTDVVHLKIVGEGDGEGGVESGHGGVERDDSSCALTVKCLKRSLGVSVGRWQAGRRLRVQVDINHVHFFEECSGENILKAGSR